jgi:hypothetical protein
MQCLADYAPTANKSLHSPTPAMGATSACAPHAQSTSTAASGRSSTSNDSSVESPLSLRIRQAHHCRRRVHVLTTHQVRRPPVRRLFDIRRAPYQTDSLHNSEPPPSCHCATRQYNESGTDLPAMVSCFKSFGAVQRGLCLHCPYRCFAHLSRMPSNSRKSWEQAHSVRYAQP